MSGFPRKDSRYWEYRVVDSGMVYLVRSGRWVIPPTRPYHDFMLFRNMKDGLQCWQWKNSRKLAPFWLCALVGTYRGIRDALKEHYNAKAKASHREAAEEDTLQRRHREAAAS